MNFVWRRFKAVRFSVRAASVVLTFLFANGGNMSKKIQKKVIDVTGVALTPGEPSACLGNGKHGVECCCDECDYYLSCFPEADAKKKELLGL